MSRDIRKTMTITRRALVPRPDTGLQAWQATLGYMSNFHSPDAILTTCVRPDSESLRWSATVTWGQRKESVTDRDSLAAVLRDLWALIERYHNIFLAPEDSTRAPSGYGDYTWLDVDTLDTLHRFILTTQTVFEDDWRIVTLYRSLDRPQQRVQIRLIAREERVAVGGSGPTQMDATQAIFRHAAPAFASHTGVQQTDENEAPPAT